MEDPDNGTDHGQIDPTAAPVVVMKYGNKAAIVRRTIPSSAVTSAARKDIGERKTKPVDDSERWPAGVPRNPRG